MAEPTFIGSAMPLGATREPRIRPPVRAGAVHPNRPVPASTTHKASAHCTVMKRVQCREGRREGLASRNGNLDAFAYIRARVQSRSWGALSRIRVTPGLM